MNYLRAVLIVIICLYTLCSHGAYKYPITNPFMSTVAGTPEALRPDFTGLSIRDVNLRIKQPLTKTVIPLIFSSFEQALFRFSWQEHPAPLIFLIAGTGARFDAHKAEYLKKLFYQAGFHVIQLSSPTSPDFIVNSSSTHLPGNSQQDANDLYKLMQASLQRAYSFHKKLKVNSIHLAGYSLGALNAAYVSFLDDKKKKIGFKRTLLINPPVYLACGLNNLDRMTQVKIAGKKNTSTLFNTLFDQLVEYFRQHNTMDFDGALKSAVGQTVENLSNDELALLIGVYFRFSVASIVFTADVINKSGFIVPKQKSLGITNPRTPYFYQAMSWDFEKYVKRMLLPSINKQYLQNNQPALSLEEVIHQNSLPVLKDWLKHSPNVGIVHNADDPIIDQAGLTFIYDVFDARAKIYPFGGHMGNLQYTTNAKDMVNFIKTGGFPDA